MSLIDLSRFREAVDGCFHPHLPGNFVRDTWYEHVSSMFTGRRYLDREPALTVAYDAGGIVVYVREYDDDGHVERSHMKRFLRQGAVWRLWDEDLYDDEEPPLPIAHVYVFHFDDYLSDDNK